MATTRYVWKKYTIQETPTYELSGTFQSVWCATDYSIISTNCTLAEYDTPYGSVVRTLGDNSGGSYDTIQCTAGKYYTFAYNYNSPIMVYCETSGIISVSKSNSTASKGVTYSVSSGSFSYVYKYTEVSKGSLLGEVSNIRSVAYPTDGESGDYWYEYEGSDNIDPRTVSSPTNPISGQSTTVTVTSSSSKKYGGNVSYRYEYSTNGGRSWSVSGTTASTTRAIDVPDGASKFRARVRAQDDIGFTSETYVYSVERTVVTNVAPLAPPSLNVPSEIYGGSTITISWAAASDSDGNLAGYQLERSTNNGSTWARIYDGASTSTTNLVEEGLNTVMYRVRAYDSYQMYSGYTTGVAVTVINNVPPSAPSSISTGVVVGGQQVTITVGAATDSDGTVVNYIYERSVDGNGWTQIAKVNSLSYTDTVGTEWATVAYRVCAEDDDGAVGPYVTGETAMVNSGWLFISGPAENMGNKPAPFEFAVSAGVSGTSGVSGITMRITLDGVEQYYDTVSDTDTVTLEMDTRLMGEGTHTIAVAVSKDTYLPTSRAYVFTVPAFDLPDGGRMLQLENRSGQAIFPVTLARAVIGYDGRSLAEITEELLVASMGGAKIAAGTYAGGGTFGQNSPNLLAFAFVPKLLLLLDNLGALTVVVPSIGKYSPRLGTTGAGTVSVSGTSVSWYAASAVDQMNSSGKTYTYVAVG